MLCKTPPLFNECFLSTWPRATPRATPAFGWSSGEVFRQHDVQELNRVLVDNLEQKLAGTAQGTALGDLFRGEMESYVRCAGGYTSSRREAFYDLALEVRGCCGRFVVVRLLSLSSVGSAANWRVST